MTEASDRAASWLADLETALATNDAGAVLDQFLPECYWRDFLAFTWNLRTFEGPAAIRAMLGATMARTGARDFTLEREAEVDEDGVVEAFFTFATALGRGRGVVKLKDGKGWTLLTTLQELTGYEEPSGRRRPRGVEHGPVRDRRTWKEERAAECASLGRDTQPYCVIIGGGQGGIALGARLKRLGVPTIIIERNARPGDSWRNRYRTLVLHDPVWYDHLPYLPFPDDWPVFTPKDKFGDFLEAYASIMELDYWGSTECLGAERDDARGTWRVTVRREGEEIELRPTQLVFATGAYGPPRIPDFPGRDDFQGTLIHSSDYEDGEPYRGKTCVIIGTGSSGHDIAADLWEHDARSTLVQRSPTIVVRSETLMEMSFAGLYSEEAVAKGITTDIADMKFAATPLALVPGIHVPIYRKIRARDAEFYDRLARAGFLYDFGEDESGLLMRAFRTASNYYIDVGGSELVCRGEVAIRSGVGVARLNAGGVVLDDGTELAADLVVCATGYQTMDEMIAALVSREVADRVGPCWGIGSGVRNDPGPWLGELRNLWKPTGKEGLWVHGGNLAMSRFYSLFLALQLKARMEGLDIEVYDGPVRMESA